MLFRAHHVAIRVVEMDRSVAFYEQLGFVPTRHYSNPDGAFQLVHMRLDDFIMELFSYRDSDPGGDARQRRATDLRRVGMKHFALRVESILDAKQYLESLGLASDISVTMGQKGVSYFFIQDPNGIEVEVVEDDSEAAIVAPAGLPTGWSV
jgi:catechol 2,3-dioxygenase-like lactoylglutathione lyase family enzyme